MNLILLEDLENDNLITLGRGNIISKEEMIQTPGDYPVYSSSATKNGEFGRYGRYMFDDERITWSIDGGGRLFYRDKHKYSVTNVCGWLKVNTEQLLTKYVYYCLHFQWSLLNFDYTYKAHPSVIRKLYKIPMISLTEQQKIVRYLDRINNLIDKNIDSLSYYDELIKSRFIEMFGDPIDNPYGWVLKPLLSLGECKNGMNFRNDEQGVDIHCLGVGDFKNLSIIDDVAQLPIVSLNCMPSSEYLLKDGDIVFVRSNGNKALVGRSIAIYPKETSTTFSGFCIRFRKKSDDINTYYLLQVFKSDSTRRKMAGRGANIQNLNQQILASLNIPIPPIELQNDYETFVKLIDKSKFSVQKEIELYKELLEKKMNEYFG